MFVANVFSKINQMTDLVDSNGVFEKDIRFSEDQLNLITPELTVIETVPISPRYSLMVIVPGRFKPIGSLDRVELTQYDLFGLQMLPTAFDRSVSVRQGSSLKLTYEPDHISLVHFLGIAGMPL